MKKTFNLFALLCTLGLMLVVLAGCKEKPLPTTTQAPAPVTTTEAPAPRTTTEEPAPVTTTEAPAPQTTTEEPAPVTTTEHVHSWGEGTVTTNPTCTTAGVRTFTCSCGQTKTEAEPALGHNMTHHEAVAATCTEAGSIEYWSCSRCSKNFSDEAGQTEVSSIVVAALNHDFEQKVSYAKIVDGKIEILNVCKRDASHTELVSTKYINEYDTIAHATGFNNNNTTVMDGSTYAIDPSTKTVTIKTLPSSMGAWFRFDFARNSSTTYKYGFVVLKGDNDALNVAIKFDTLAQDGIANNKYDGTNGNKQYKKVGNDTIVIVWDFEALQMNSKELAKVVIWAYGNGGATNIKLEIVASGMFNLNEGSEKVLEHNLVNDAAVAPTCTVAGHEAGQHCSGCDYKVGGAVIAATGHTEVVDVAVAPTCTATGLTEGKRCSVCGEILVAQQVVAALGHVEVVDPEQPATYDAAGLTEGKHCSRCGAVLEAQESIPKLKYTITIESNGGTVKMGDNLIDSLQVEKGTPASSLSALTIIAPEHYHFVKWQMLVSENYVDIPDGATITANITIRPYFEKDRVSITKNFCEGVTSSIASDVEYDGEVSFTLSSAGAEYDISSVVVKANGVTLVPVAGEYTLSNVTEAQEVVVTGVIKAAIADIDLVLIPKNGTSQLAPVITSGGTFTISYESSDETIATVSDSGLITAVSNKVGEVTITLSIGSVELDVDVIVYTALLTPNGSGKITDTDFKNIIEADMNGYYVLTGDAILGQEANGRFLNPVGYLSDVGNGVDTLTAVEGTHYNSFNGTLNGLGHTLSYGYNWGGLNGNSHDEYLFYSIGTNGVLKNLGMIATDQNTGVHRRAAVALFLNGLMENCYVRYNMADAGNSANTTWDKSAVAMVIGGTVRNCVVYLNITGTGGSIATVWASKLLSTASITNCISVAVTAGSQSLQNQGSGESGYFKNNLVEARSIDAFISGANETPYFDCGEYFTITETSISFGSTVVVSK